MMSLLEKELVEEHLELVPRMVEALTHSCSRLSCDEKDELMQTGYLALCRAAMQFDWRRPFISYARASIRNAIYDYWRSAKEQKERFCSLDTLMTTEDGDTYEQAFPSLTSITPSTEQLAMGKLSYEYLQRLENTSAGVIKKGITSLRLQQHGYTSADLATIYHVPSNRVRAWQSKARKVLKEDQELYALLA